MIQKFWSHGTNLGSLRGLKRKNQPLGFANHGFLVTTTVVYNTGVVARLEEFFIPRDYWGFLWISMIILSTPVCQKVGTFCDMGMR